MSLAQELTADCQEWEVRLRESPEYHNLRRWAYNLLYMELRHEMVMWLDPQGNLRQQGPGWWVIMGLQ